MLFGPCYVGSKGLQQVKNWQILERRASGSLEWLKTPKLGNTSFSFLTDLLKNSELVAPKDAQKHFKSVFEHPKKFLIKIPKLKFYKNAKITKGKQAFLGILACFLGS